MFVRLNVVRASTPSEAQRRNAMSSNGQAIASQPSSTVATNAGTTKSVPDLNVPATRIYGFVERFRKEYFEDHSLDWSLDQILTRGMAEIERQVKTARERAKQKAAGDLLKEFNLTPAEAKRTLLDMLRQQSEAAKLASTTKSS